MESNKENTNDELDNSNLPNNFVEDLIKEQSLTEEKRMRNLDQLKQFLNTEDILDFGGQWTNEPKVKPIEFDKDEFKEKLLERLRKQQLERGMPDRFFPAGTPENMEVKKERTDFIENLKNGNLRQKMVPLSIPDEIKKMKSFPTEIDEITSHQPESSFENFGKFHVPGLDDKGFEDFLNGEEPAEKAKEKEHTITLRVPKSVHDKLTEMVIQRSADTGQILNKSSYLRLLIEKDHKERTKFKF